MNLINVKDLTICWVGKKFYIPADLEIWQTDPKSDTRPNFKGTKSKLNWSWTRIVFEENMTLILNIGGRLIPHKTDPYHADRQSCNIFSLIKATDLTLCLAKTCFELANKLILNIRTDWSSARLILNIVTDWDVDWPDCSNRRLILNLTDSYHNYHNM